MAKITFSLDITKEHKAAIRRLADKTTYKKWLKALMQSVGEYWHKSIFPGHFTPGAETRYGYEKRTDAYMKKKRQYGVGQGRYVANIFSGKSARWMQSMGYTTATSDKATVHLPAPAYFRKPFIGTIRFASGKSMTIRRQPDKPSEVTRVNAADMEKIKRFSQSKLDELISKSTSRAA